MEQGPGPFKGDEVIIGATPLTAIFGSGVDPRDHAAMRDYVRACCNAGLAVLFIAPGTKEPVDCRSTPKRTADDLAAREAARDAGRPDWERVRAPKGLHLATAEDKWAQRYLDRYLQLFPDPDGGDPVAVNLAVEVGRSRLVVVDCDTAEEVAEFLAVSGVAGSGIPPTVRSPGKQLPDGSWVHRDGGHFYFTVPDGVEMPDEAGSLNLGETGFAVLWRNRYVLIPPSVRAEGAYELVGRDAPLPDRLYREIVRRADLRAERRQRSRAAAGGDADEIGARVDAWAATVSWDELLTQQDWVAVASSDSCGCPMYTAPGDHSSPKSGTAHDSGCSLDNWDTDVNAPLHIWTDHPGPPFEAWIRERGTSTVPKLVAVSLIEYGGDMNATLDAIGALPGQIQVEGTNVATLRRTGDIGDVRAARDELPPPAPPEPEPAQPEAPTDEYEAPADEETFPEAGSIDPTTGLYMPLNVGMPTVAPFEHWRDTPPPVYIVADLLEHGGLTSVIGAPGAGKSSVVIDMMCHICTGRTWQGHRVLKSNVLYLPGEGLAGVVARINAWCEAREVALDGALRIGNPIIGMGASKEAWAELRDYVTRAEIGLVVFDTLARMSGGMDENAASDMNLVIKRFDNIRQFANTGVLVIHHTGHSAPDRGRGSSALNGALESELLVRADRERITFQSPLTGAETWARQVHVSTTKQKNAPYDPDESIDLLLSDFHGAALITGANGSIDPMQGEVVLAPPAPERVVDTAIRLREFADRFTEQGVTRSELCLGVRPDPYTERAPHVARAWRLRVAEAVDRALRYGLLETLTGAAAGQRYLPGAATPEQARAQADDEMGLPGDV